MSWAGSELDIEPGQTELELRIDRQSDWRKEGWITADTHVHFISPDTAVLEATGRGPERHQPAGGAVGRPVHQRRRHVPGPLVSPDKETAWRWQPRTASTSSAISGCSGVHGDPVFPHVGRRPHRSLPWRSLVVRHVGVGGRVPQARGRGGCCAFPDSERRDGSRDRRREVDAVEFWIRATTARSTRSRSTSGTVTSTAATGSPRPAEPTR